MIIEPNAREMTSVQFLAALHGETQKSEDILKERLRTKPDAWRQYRIAMAFLDHVIDWLYETLPNKTLLYMCALHKNGEVIIRKKRPTAIENDIQLVPVETLNILANAAVANECPICLRTVTEVKHCPLRKALLIVARPNDIPTNDVCPYRNISEEKKI